MKANVLLAGVGGQGILFIGKLLAQAAMREGQGIVMSETHGLAQRGGAIVSEIRIGEVSSPIIPAGEADLLIAFEPLEALRSLPRLSKRSIVILNTAILPPFAIQDPESPYPSVETIIATLQGAAAEVVAVNADELADRSGDRRSSNVALLGVVAGLGRLPVREETIHTLFRELTGPRAENNLRAFEVGEEAGLRVAEGSQPASSLAAAGPT